MQKQISGPSTEYLEASGAMYGPSVGNPFLLIKPPPNSKPPEVFVIRGRFLANVPQK